MGSVFGSTEDCSTPFTSIYEIPVTDIDGQQRSMEEFRGSVLMIVNVACKCGLTQKSYKQMADLHRQYRDRGFQVLAFPCNQFMSQEPWPEQRIKEFALAAGADFPLFAKIEVNGKNAHPLFKFMRHHSKLKGATIGWNFGKFLIARDGSVVGYYGPKTDPIKTKTDIERLLCRNKFSPKL